MNAVSLQKYNLSLKLIEKIVAFVKVFLPLFELKEDCVKVWKILELVKKFFFNLFTAFTSQSFLRSSSCISFKVNSGCQRLESENCFSPFNYQPLLINFKSTTLKATLFFLYLLSSLNWIDSLISFHLAFFAFFKITINFWLFSLWFFNQIELALKNFDFCFKSFSQPGLKGPRSRQYILDLEHTSQCPFSSG